MNDNCCLANRAYAQRLAKERCARRANTLHYYGAKGETLLEPKMAPQFTAKEAALLRYGFDARSGQRGEIGGGMSSQRRSIGAAAAGVLHKASRGKSASESSLLCFDNQKRRSLPASSCGTASCRTASTRLTRGSALWREMEQVVQEEVLRAVRPLQEQLESESVARQQAIDHLRRAGIPLPDATLES
eukprot:TRINITY_DN58625_c0_g1_i1.p1 TRINITY_DN58625_c0_g1~~TRINITY_DN58625_c0_g1_i1.p1  ORF type:complete len:188 (-),score=31.74 TRINITY_DN58625_c0_g1_i1:82-645(-)